MPTLGCSYAHVNWDYRQARRKGVVRPGERGSPELPEGFLESDPLQYPENITLKNLAYFAVAPTLCYQPAYPRNNRFRLKWLLRCGWLEGGWWDGGGGGQGRETG